MNNNNRLIIFSGPSCVGKSPLAKTIARFHPDIYKSLQPLVLYNSRAARPGEMDGIDYHFRTREEIEKLKNKDNFVVMDVRGDLQAIDINELSELLQDGDVFFEGNPFVGRELQINSSLENINKLSVFMAPLSREEILFLKSVKPEVSLPDLVTDIMRRKLLRRTGKQKGELSLKDLENIEKRAGSAYRELMDAHYFEYVIPNHDGEDSENWNAFYHPIGDARKSFVCFMDLFRGNTSQYVEKWEKDLISQ